MAKLGTKVRLLAAATMIGAFAIGSGTAAGAATKTSKSSVSKKASATGSADPWGWPGNATKGYLPTHEPAVHGGKVKVGLITAGTIHDHGYYQSEVTAIDEYAKKYHWETPIVEGSVPAANALAAAQNMCSQGVDLLVIGESQLASAEAATSSSVCKDTPVWIYTSKNVPLTAEAKPYMNVATGTGVTATFATGVAMGLWLKAHKQTTAGYVTGPALSFTEAPAQAYLAGMHYVTKRYTIDAIYDGSLTAPGPAITAAQSMITKGIKLIFPYLGGALIPAAKYIASKGGASPSDGGQWCDHAGVKFAIEESYNPGYYLTPELTEFAHSRMRVGVVEIFSMGKTKVPNVSFCSPTAHVPASATTMLKKVIKQIKTHQITPTALVKATPIPS